MDLAIGGRTALVFGGSRGMGRSCAQQLSMEGVHVTIAARTRETLAQAAAEISAQTRVPVRFVVADISTPAGRDAALAACPAPDLLINNADGPKPGDFRDWTRDDWQQALDALMLGPIEMIRRTVDGMVERRFGRIVNIVSRSVKSPQAELGLSNGARSGLVGFVAGLARQTVRHNVTINNLLPGVFATDAQRRHIRGMLEPAGKSFDQLWQERGSNNPAGRYGQPEELGALCAFICSAHAGYITGQSLMIDGGGYPGTF
ncbi:SDR family oxidoreductase [Verminephrobacter aporrectodeae]|uniref:SDR family oxidoreductase n=1 Tax=Verminephrobacter aporrectodeae TaxID=1110389 RepID=UPI0002376FCE|nr:SDR family oxidoreductase [Verminephrobacter aporrectodeae]MCW8174122.1 SDR family oxidoreductase [Verminephrobacter aporrectodeae subsp. tuberculatae]MCW8201909.1 SDR family oxidoreductase [Verminephrobacter aporrectodeae subsp. tuberculatae]MCW8205810.1 SDR family oxidoreductase [Verminephrobacter aporrectodeae subsp. tuberculatae]